MVDWKSYKGQGAWAFEKTKSSNFKQGTPFEFIKSVDKLYYNEGNRIASFDDPVWATDFTGESVSDGHQPCGYWYKDPDTPWSPPQLYTLWSTGDNAFLQLGHGSGAGRNVFEEIAGLYAADMNSQGNFSWSLNKNGYVYAWGVNSYFQCNDNFPATNVDVPTRRYEKPAMSSIGAGADFAFGVGKDGYVYCAGHNDFGQLGLGYTSNAIKGLSDKALVVSSAKVAAGGYDFGYVGTTNGTVFSTGHGNYYVLGHGNTSNLSTFTYVSSLPRKAIKKIECGYYHTMVLYEDTSLYTVGRNNRGQCGVGNFNLVTNFTQVSGSWLDVACANARHTLGIKADGTLWACGLADYYQTGQGNTTDLENFTQIGLATNWISCATGYDYSVMVNSLGELWGVGNNNKGQLGDENGYTTKKTLVKATVDGFCKVTAGKWFTVALKIVT